jgi:hypothetical protein
MSNDPWQEEADAIEKEVAEEENTETVLTEETIDINFWSDQEKPG